MDLHFITENTRTVIYNTPRLSGLVADLSLGKYSLRYILEKEDMDAVLECLTTDENDLELNFLIDTLKTYSKFNGVAIPDYNQ
jgi:hypothetical protein